VWNCVGAGNHRQFVLFITMLVFGILFFDYLSFNCKWVSYVPGFILTLR
jgi:hypothetical protein